VTRRVLRASGFAVITAVVVIISSARVGETALADVGSTARVSVGIDGAEANSSSMGASVSADGRYVAFYSGASNLVADDTNNTSDVFLRDRVLGVTERVSIGSDGSEANANSSLPSLSSDGRHVAFESGASNLVEGDTNAVGDVFVHDRVLGVTELVSIGGGRTQANDYSTRPSMSGDGQYVAFESRATNLVADNSNSKGVFVRDRLSNVTERVSVGNDGTQADGDSWGPAISGDGRFVAFPSAATNLVFGDTNDLEDLFVRDRVLGVTERVSVRSGGTQANGESYYPSMSFDGRYVAFESWASNLVTGDTSAFGDVFVHDLGASTSVSRVAALGDSFTSGEGAGYVGFEDPSLYLVGTATSLNGCHRSHTAYGQRIRNAFGVADEDFLFVACSGARTDHLLEEGKWASSPPGVSGAQPQVVELAKFQTDGDVDLALLGVGGNDVGFADILAACVFERTACSAAERPLVANTINAVFPRLVDTYKAVRAAAPSAEVYVMGYPQFLNPSVSCLATVGLSSTERSWMRDRVTQLNDVIELATEAAGVHFVDIEDVLEPDELVCGSDAKVHGIIAHVAWLPVLVESFHPTAEGHEVFAEAFFAQYPQLGENPNPSPAFVAPPEVVGPGIQFGSMTVADGRVVRKIGDEVLMTMPGFEPGSTVTVGTYSEYEPYGVFEVDGSGTLAFAYRVPVEIEPGQHTIEAVGTAESGDTLIAATALIIMDAGGTFTDDDGNVHEPAIEGIAFSGITRGCNPPANDHYCPDGSVTRGQMAAFLARALRLADDGGGSAFVDDDDSVFEADIARLAAAGITRGCNPPTNDRFCPGGNVTRGQMAAFLVRALGLADDGGGSAFVDDDDSVFEADIARLAAAGITRGCNPPANDHYCPDDPVTRAQMATFLVRGLNLATIVPPE